MTRTPLSAGSPAAPAHRGRRAPSGVALALLLAACGGDPMPADGGRPLDSGGLDAGAPSDAGFDGGGADDGGLEDDAGLGDDAATGPDAGSDAGVAPTEYPLDFALPAGTTMVSVTRLGDGSFVLASIRDTDPSTPAGEALVLQRILRVGHALVPEPEHVLAETTISPGIDNPIHLVGAIGDAHFFVVVSPPEGALRLRFFTHRDGGFVDLGTTELGDDAFLSAHPVDARRHLLGFRPTNSGQAFRYRLLLRDGDTLTLGPAVLRPAPSEFPGLSTSESQADPALFRVGPTTFVEARPGYVPEPGDLATWTLTVGDDDSVVPSAPTVHATVSRTLSPEVAADGRGGALVVYFPYGDAEAQWYLALYDHSTRMLGPERELVRAWTSPIRAHQGESTDRHLGGAYYLRPVGGADGVAPLLRVDATAGTVTTVADVPSLWRCYRAPQLVRAGTIAALAGCDRVVFVDLLPSCGDGAVGATEGCDDGANVDGDGCSAGCTIEPGVGPT